MTEIHGIIEQLKSRGGAYVNVLRSLTDGGVGIWGNAYGGHTYLLVENNTWLLVVFDDADWEAEKLPDLIRSWKADMVFRLPGMEPMDPDTEARTREWRVIE